MVTSRANSEGSCRSRPSGFNEIDGRHDWTRTSDLYRVNFEVDDLKPFPHLAFPHSKGPKTPSKLPSFDGELMASFSDLARSMSAIAISQQLAELRGRGHTGRLAYPPGAS